MRRKKYTPEKPFVAHSLRLLSSPAWQSLTLAEMKILHRLEVEHLRHGGKQNGELICPFRDFGIWRTNIKPAIERLAACGLLEIRRGRGGTLGYGKAHRYRLTYVPTWNGKWVAPTDEWRKVGAAHGTKTVPRDRGTKTVPRSYAKMPTCSGF